MGKRKGASDPAVEAPVPNAPTVSAGPLARWRLLLAVAVAGVTTGSNLWAAAGTGEQLDLALLRSFGVWFLTWAAVGRINNVLRQAEADELVQPAARRAGGSALPHDADAGGHDADSSRAA